MLAPARRLAAGCRHRARPGPFVQRRQARHALVGKAPMVDSALGAIAPGRHCLVMEARPGGPELLQGTVPAETYYPGHTASLARFAGLAGVEGDDMGMRVVGVPWASVDRGDIGRDALRGVFA